MRIIYVLPSDLSAKGGHIQHVLGLCKYAIKSEIDLELFHIYSSEDRSFEEFKTTAFRVNDSSPQKRIFSFCKLALEELDRRPKPDWVYFRPFPLDYLLLSRHFVQRNIKYSYEINTLWANELRSQGKNLKALIYPWFEAKSIRHASIIFPVTQEIANYSQSAAKHNIPTLITGNGIEIPELPLLSKEDLKKKWALPPDKYLIVMAGFTRAWHGHEKLLEALPSLPENFHLVLIGSESDDVTKRVYASADSLKIRQRVHIFPWLTHLEVDEILFICDLGVSPLNLAKKKMKEAQSLKVRHYLAMGIPVLIAGGESKVVLDSNFTYQIKDTSTDQIIEGLLKIQKLHPPREEIRNFARAELSWEAIAKKTWEFLLNTF